jgi:hypothetical protein
VSRPRPKVTEEEKAAGDGQHNDEDLHEEIPFCRRRDGPSTMDLPASTSSYTGKQKHAIEFQNNWTPRVHEWAGASLLSAHSVSRSTDDVVAAVRADSRSVSG